MSCSQSSVAANSGRPSSSLSARSAAVVRIRGISSRHRVVSHGQLGPSVPLRWRPAHGRHPVVSLWPWVGASRSQAWAFHAREIADFGHEGLAFQAPVSECFSRLPVSQRLKPQCVVMQPHSNAKLPACAFIALVAVALAQPWCSATQVSASKAKRCVVQQPPNPSFKRTRLRRSA